ncbi:Ionotropic receptor 207 [Frankliniella occidentalis]|nr:Ionotropic receptor 207 [Frankliniella occidentalis]
MVGEILRNSPYATNPSDFPLVDACLVAVLLCCAAPVVRAGLPVVDSAAPPEARSAAALLSPFMASQKATLILRGSSRWTGAFLRELSADIPRVLVPRPRRGSTALGKDKYPDTLQHDRLEHGLMSTCLVHFFPADDVDELLYTLRTYPASKRGSDLRVLFWATRSASASRDKVEQWLDVLVGGHQRALALTYPNGSTTLYNLPLTFPYASRGTKTRAFEMDNWSPVEQRWRLGVTVFHEYCRGYRQTGKRQDLTVYLISAIGLTQRSSLVELTKSALNLAGRGHQGRLISETPVLYQLPGVWNSSVFLALKECTLAALLSDELFFSQNEVGESSFIPDTKMAEFAVIVPAGYGATVGVLDAVTVEFSPALWLATALATLSTVVVFACARRQDVSGAVLRALAPMLGQAPPPPAPPRPMLAAWLLACVVLTAAYQGLLLGKLFSAAPRRELNSLKDLEDSGLPLKSRGNLGHSNLLTDNLNARIQSVRYSEIKTVIDTIATARNCALVTFYNRHTYSYMRPHMMPKKVHFFRLSSFHFNMIAVTTKGSPLEGPIATVQGRVEAAGLLARWRSAEYEREHQEDSKRLLSLRGPKSMTLWHLQPAFVVLGAGHTAAVVAFALEAVCAWRARWAARKTG